MWRSNAAPIFQGKHLRGGFARVLSILTFPFALFIDQSEVMVAISQMNVLIFIHFESHSVSVLLFRLRFLGSFHIVVKSTSP